jgi:hypothetical protein
VRLRFSLHSLLGLIYRLERETGNAVNSKQQEDSVNDQSWTFVDELMYLIDLWFDEEVARKTGCCGGDSRIEASIDTALETWNHLNQMRNR